MGKRRILLVEDEPSVVKTVGKRLEVAGFDVIVAVNGEEALSKAQEERPDLIVLDLMLPTIDGFEICERLKKDHPSMDIPVVVIFTGKGQEEEEERCRQLGAAAFISKTRGTGVLIEQINALLDRR